MGLLWFYCCWVWVFTTSVRISHEKWGEQTTKLKETLMMVMMGLPFFFLFFSPRDEVEEKHKSSSYHRHSYHLLQHDSQDASAEQRYKSAQPPLSPCMDSVQAAFVLLSPAGLHVWGECLCFVS